MRHPKLVGTITLHVLCVCFIFYRMAIGKTILQHPTVGPDSYVKIGVVFELTPTRSKKRWRSFESNRNVGNHMLVSSQRAQIRRADAKLYRVSWVGPSWQRLNGRRHHKCDVSYALWPVDDEATGSPCAYAAVNADALDALQRVGTSVRPLSRYPLLSSPPPSHSSTEQYCGGCLRRT
jgi:hypothetical protein